MLKFIVTLTLIFFLGACDKEIKPVTSQSEDSHTSESEHFLKHLQEGHGILIAHSDDADIVIAEDKGSITFTKKFLDRFQDIDKKSIPSILGTGTEYKKTKKDGIIFVLRETSYKSFLDKFHSYLIATKFK